MSNFGNRSLRDVVLVDPTTGLPYVAQQAGAGGGATDANLTPSSGATSSTATQWTELFPALSTRLGGIVQNRDATNALYILRSDSIPANGSAPGEIEIGLKPNAYVFDMQPKGRWLVRGVVASQSYGLNLW